MKQELIAAGFFLFSFMLPLRATAANFSQIYVFGDSLCDTGNMFQLTGGCVEPKNADSSDTPYFQGRFSNGKLWVEYFASLLGLTYNQATNFAIAGSSSGNGNSVHPDSPFPGLLAQVRLFVESLGAKDLQADSEALYVLCGGSNDYLFGGVTDVNLPVNHLSTAVKLLKNIGAKSIMVFNLPDLGKIPAKFGTADADKFSTLAKNHNAALDCCLTPSGLKRSALSHADLNIILVDIYSLLNKIIAQKSVFGFTNIQDSLFSVSPTISIADEYLFYDDFHPTTTAHKLIAESVLLAIKDQSCQNSIMLNLLALAVGTASIR